MYKLNAKRTDSTTTYQYLEPTYAFYVYIDRYINVWKYYELKYYIINQIVEIVYCSKITYYIMHIKICTSANLATSRIFCFTDLRLNCSVAKFVQLSVCASPIGSLFDIHLSHEPLTSNTMMSAVIISKKK